MIMVINNFFTETECNFWSTYCNYAINNDSLEVNLTTGKRSDKVNRNYYTLKSQYKFMDKVKQLACKNWKQNLYYQRGAYGHIMHYKDKGQGLQWHHEPHISTVSCGINISPSTEYKGANLEFRNSKLSVPYKALVMYDGYELHRVTNLDSGQKKSIVMWLQNKEQNK
jgi:predicted 2-oxoglutarate/Fe(II)-dependent dioxygenase YbiX